MNDAINDELIATNPCRIVGAGKPRAKGAAEALSAHEVGPYLDAVEEYYRPALAVAVLGGLRPTRDFAPDDLLFPARRTRKTMNETVLASAHRRAAKITGRPTLNRPRSATSLRPHDRGVEAH